MNIKYVGRWLVVAAVSAVVTSGTCFAQAAFALQTRTLNAETSAPQNTFAPGEEVVVEINATIPPQYQGQTISLVFGANATVAGFRLPISLLNTAQIANSLAIADPTLDGPLFQSGAEQFRFKIPKEAPDNASLQVNATATVNIKIPKKSRQQRPRASSSVTIFVDK